MYGTSLDNKEKELVESHDWVYCEEKWLIKINKIKEKWPLKCRLASSHGSVCLVFPFCKLAVSNTEMVLAFNLFMQSASIYLHWLELAMRIISTTQPPSAHFIFMLSLLDNISLFFSSFVSIYTTLSFFFYCWLKTSLLIIS